MAVKKKIATTPKFLGIVVAGASYSEAQDRYRETALNEQTVALQSASGEILATHSECAAGDFFNSLSGELDLTQVDRPLRSNSSNQGNVVDAFLSVCADGCGDFIIHDCKKVSFCPSCSSEVPELDEDELHELIAESDEIESLEDEAGDYPDGDQGIVVSASSFEEAHDRYHSLASGELDGLLVSDEAPCEMGISESGANDLSYITHPDCVHSYSPYFGSESLAIGDEVDATESEMVSESNVDNEESKAHYLLCQSSDCPEPHIISTKGDGVFCPSCSCAVVDPELLAELQESESASDFDEDDDFDGDLDGDDDFDIEEDDEDFEDDDIEEDEDDFDSESGVADDFDFDAYEESFHSNSGSELDEDEDDLEEDEDDFDLEEDEDDFDLEEDEDDFESDSGDDSDDSDDDISLELDEDDEGEDEDDEGEDDTLESESSLDMNLLEAISAENDGKLDVALLSVANCGSVNGIGTWTAFYGDMPVALAKANAVPANVSKIFNSPSFNDATITAAKRDGVMSALSSMGFVGIKPNLDMEHVVNYTIMSEANAKVQEMVDTMTQREEHLAERLRAAVSTSFAGINRNFFAGISNPLRSKLIASISAAGLRNPEQIIDSALAESSDQLAALVIDKGMEIMGRSPEAQNELAQSISSMNTAANLGSSISSIGNVVESQQDLNANPKPNTAAQQQNAAFNSESGTKVNRLKTLLNR